MRSRILPFVAIASVFVMGFLVFATVLLPGAYYRVQLQPQVTAKFTSPFDSEIRLRLLNQVTESGTPGIHIQVVQEGLKFNQDVVKRLDVSPLAVYPDGYVRVPGAWRAQFERSLELGEPVPFESQVGDRVTIFYRHRDVETGEVEIWLVLAASGAAEERELKVVLCPDNCGSSFGQSDSHLAGIDVVNNHSDVKIVFDQRWRVVEP